MGRMNWCVRLWLYKTLLGIANGAGARKKERGDGSSGEVPVTKTSDKIRRTLIVTRYKITSNQPEFVRLATLAPENKDNESDAERELKTRKHYSSRKSSRGSDY